jgi:hypothetical protein
MWNDDTKRIKIYKNKKIARSHVLASNTYIYVGVQNVGSYRVFGFGVVFGRCLSTFGGECCLES